MGKKLNTDIMKISHQWKNVRTNAAYHLQCLPLEQMISVIQDVLRVEFASVYVKLVLLSKAHAIKLITRDIGFIDINQVCCFRDINYDIKILIDIFPMKYRLLYSYR